MYIYRPGMLNSTCAAAPGSFRYTPEWQSTRVYGCLLAVHTLTRFFNVLSNESTCLGHVGGSNQHILPVRLARGDVCGIGE